MYINKAEQAKRLLAGMTCKECKFYINITNSCKYVKKTSLSTPYKPLPEIKMCTNWKAK